MSARILIGTPICAPVAPHDRVPTMSGLSARDARLPSEQGLIEGTGVMSDIELRHRRTARAPAETPGARESRLSRLCLMWLAAAPFVGFVLAGRVFNLGSGDDWEPWKAAVLGMSLMTPFAIGAYLGARSVWKGFKGGWVGLMANLFLGVLAVGMPVSESLTG